MRYVDPFTSKQVTRSTGTEKKREAERVAAKWEAELREGRYQKLCRMSWEEFCDSFEADGCGGLKPSTVAGYMQSLDAFDRICKPRGVADLTTPKMTAFARELRKPRTVKYGKGENARTETVKLAEATVASHLRHLKRAGRWAARQGFLVKAPLIDMPKNGSGARRMKGRPITSEEFERMLTVTDKVVGDKAAESWKLLLNGLWASGLRLSEAMTLTWDQRANGVWVVLNGRKSLLAFDANSQKSGKVQLVPLAPEAVELLVPLQQPTGYVFNPKRQDGLTMAKDAHKASKIICTIGKKANVVVDDVSGKCASAHDLRRAFGYRWSRRVRTPQLKELMRHASIETTLTYYVGQNAESTAEELWAALGSIPGSIADSEPVDSSPAHKKTPAKTEVL